MQYNILINLSMSKKIPLIIFKTVVCNYSVWVLHTHIFNFILLLQVRERVIIMSNNGLKFNELLWS